MSCNVNAYLDTSYPSQDIDKSDNYLMGNIPNVKIREIRYEPYPVSPGDFFDIWLQIENVGDEKAENVVVEFLESNTFKIDGEKIKKIGILGSRQAAVLQFENIKTGDNAVEGENELLFKINMGGGYVLEPITTKARITIRSVEPLLMINVRSEPEKIPQGGTAKINIELTNKDTSYLRDISIRLKLPATIIPIGSNTEKKIQRLNPEATGELEFTVLADPDADSSAYTIPIDVIYYDETGDKHSRNDTIGVMVDTKPDYTLNLEEFDAFSKGMKGKVVIGLSNTGPSHIKFLSIELRESKDYEIISPSISYLGNMESDDFETAEFEIYTKSKGEIPLILKIEYRDSFNNKHSDNEILMMRVFSGTELSRYGFASSKIGMINYFIYLILIIFVYLTFNKWKEERNMTKAMKYSLKRILVGIANIIRKIRWSYIKRIPKKIKLYLE